MTYETLKPCPFCGYGARVEATRDAVGDYQGYVECLDCGATVYGPGDMPDAESAMNEAVSAWNRRAERTCHNKLQDYTDYAGRPVPDQFTCSACGAHSSTMFDAGFGDMVSDVPKFCPSCGAKVVG